jgi:mycothiol system anti-sigma-R factor
MTDDGTTAAHDHGEHDHDHSATACEEALKELYVYLDGELTDEKRTIITGHLDDCNPCLEAFDFEAELRIVISRRCHDDVPESLKLKIAHELELQADQTEDA